MVGVATLLLLSLQAEQLAWTENTPIPAERTHGIPGWTVGRFLFCRERGSLDAWVAVQGKDGKLARWTRTKNTGFTDSNWSNPVLSIGPRVYAFGHWGGFARAGFENGLGPWENLPDLPAPAGKTPSGFIGDHLYLAGLSKAGRTPVYSVRIPCER